jgi:hypothetical protein
MKLSLSNAYKEFGCLVLEVGESQAEKFLEKFKAGEYEIKKTSNKRSLNANSYCWLLCEKIAKKLKSDAVSVYRDAVLEVGVYREYHLYPDEVNKFSRDWQELGIGWQVQKVDFDPNGETIVVNAYLGSSTYTTAEMARLIDWLNQEAENIGVETADGLHIQALLNSWEEDRQNGQKRL